MAFDPKEHELNEHGFAVHKESGHMVGIEQAPAKAPHHLDDNEYPKWVHPHSSRIVRKNAPNSPEHVSVHGYEHVHVDRSDGAVTVLVHSAEDEDRAAAEVTA